MSQSLASTPQVSTSPNSISQSQSSTYTAGRSSTPHPLPSSASPFPTSTFDTIKGIAGAGLFFLVVISVLLTIILLAIGHLIMLYKREENPRPSTAGHDGTGTEGHPYPQRPNNPIGFTFITLQNPPMSGQSPRPSSGSSSSHSTPPSETDGSNSTSDGQSSVSSTIRKSGSSKTSVHASGPPSSTSNRPSPLRDPHAVGHVEQLTSPQSTDMLSNGSGPQQDPPPGLISLGNLQLSTQPGPLTSEPNNLLNGSSRQPEPAPNSS